MSCIPARKVMALVVTLIFAAALGAVTAPVQVLLWMSDPVQGWAFYDRMSLMIDRVYYRLAGEHLLGQRRTHGD